ncbi:hypothetical protein [Oscillibacter sp.]|uniref:hypothetical protein n=1 Tax=Oscillibacter sp. TaxID=1945593 RepID=UPI002899C998|nr:hypothetical protein [Oscillibacter sp.]
MKKRTVKNTAVVVTIILLCLSLVFLFHAATDALDPSTEDPEDYPSVLQSLQYPGTSALALFPDEIPESADEVYFAYDSDMGGTSLFLKYQTDIDSVQAYQRTATQRSVWSGSPAQADANSMGVYAESLAVFDYAENGIPSDLTVYVIYQNPYKENNWNHGEISLVGVSADSSEVLFVFEDW